MMSFKNFFLVFSFTVLLTLGNFAIGSDADHQDLQDRDFSISYFPSKLPPEILLKIVVDCPFEVLKILSKCLKSSEDLSMIFQRSTTHILKTFQKYMIKKIIILTLAE